MDVSIFLAKAIGLYYVIVAIAMFVNSSKFTAFLSDFAKNSTMLIPAGLFTLLIGILLVLTHNVWDSSWRIIISVIAWMALIRGIVCLIFPKWQISMIKRCVKSKQSYYSAVVIVLVLGIVLCYFGFVPVMVSA